ncbi:MAG: PEP-CTERM sorting domain-containing protein [Desulfobacula sp.]|jgi:hypothetical protein|uniref:hypothetical protein n=1 Tax=Desulfobacula sp. TaxID=2593537 RepID=UPI001D33CB66|nr:PEP-CTERM sorting domain-containing protein [Desulfobacula sp.]MBT3486260.1 PEP-CTERM sorting domain-containing protein [Desulfobacula sp.]MBT3805732.1 PEP-CTERM sorting domain-containing protein [Desulfobacula sp.]MBT4025398.1 PEP-CTERM sorting domain-containing protein [Desulfobacula sp.]MBT4200064.1 PEP-CTERM sorting domain-containing protein [Desulfobacula sp.]
MSKIMKSIINSTIIFCLLFGTSLTICAAPIQFDFEFMDSGGGSIGSGFLIFEDISPVQTEMFINLSVFSWEFDIPSLGILVSSANGDIPGVDHPWNEGIVLSGDVGSRTLQFTDANSTYIAMGRSDYSTIIVFEEFSNNVYGYQQGDAALGGGSFSAVEVTVPIPSTVFLFGIGLAGLAVFQIRSKKDIFTKFFKKRLC